MSDEDAMRVALDAARRAGLAGEPPIGACLVRAGRVIGVAANSVVSSLDVTAHAEVNAIRDACRRERALELADCVLYATVEPCPMCVAASHYAGIRRVVFGASLEDLHALTRTELLCGPSAASLGMDARSACMREDSLALLRDWCARRAA